MMFGQVPKAMPAMPQGPSATPAVDPYDDFPKASLGTGRRPALNGRITGTINEWKGKFGWIDPDESVVHPEAARRNGRLYLMQDDVLELISGVGAHVSFYVYADNSGLGAMLCVPSDSATAKKKLLKAAAKVAPKPKVAAVAGRKRVGDEKLSGKVKSWRGNFGFITPSEPVDHPLFTGSLFLNRSDIVDEGQPEVGSAVTFFLYSDPQGLGAEECTVEDGGAKAPTPKPAAAAPGSAPPAGGSNLLTAKPKASSATPAAVSADGMMMPTAKASAKAGVMKATPKASAVVNKVGGAGDPDLAKKMADHPDLAKQLSAWMFDPGG